MRNDGKDLEGLVAFIEKLALPAGFKVTTNHREFNVDGKQIAEFDVLVEGRVGTGNFRGLIQCRDRPAGGAEPGEWIEQLQGRADRFNFNKVMAVSTTGFSASAREAAQHFGIEIREVRDLTPDHFADWLGIQHVTVRTRRGHCTGGRLIINDADVPTEEAKEALKNAMATPVLRSSSTGEATSLAKQFAAIVESQPPEFFDALEPNGKPARIEIDAQYVENDHVVVETAVGLVPIRSIQFTGEIRIEQKQSAIVGSREYRDAHTGEPIDQVVTFDSHVIKGQTFAPELHKFAATGETQVVLRRLPDPPKTN